jgi:hypothetical protein
VSKERKRERKKEREVKKTQSAMPDLDSRRLAVLVACMACKVAILLVLEYLRNGDESAVLQSSQAHILAALVHKLRSTAAAIAEQQHGDKKRRRKLMREEWWVKPRSAGWANRVFAGMIDTATFRSHFRISPATMEWLCQQVAPLVERMDTHYRQSVPVKKRVAMALFRLATGAKYSEVADKFGLGESTAFICTRQLCDALCTRFKHFLAFPKPELLDQIAKRFEQISGLPNCCGAIDCMRFKIRRPARPNAGEYYDGSMFHSVIAQLVVDPESRIVNIAAGFSGGTADSDALRLSALYDDVQSRKLLHGSSLPLGDGSEIPRYLVGDGGFPLLPWLMVPYHDDAPLHPHRARFNRQHALAHFPVLRAFASLEKWRIFSCAMSVDVKTAVSMIGACAILHNMMLHLGDSLDLDEDRLRDHRVQDDSTIPYGNDYEAMRSEDHMTALQIRDALAMATDENGI